MKKENDYLQGINEIKLTPINTTGVGYSTIPIYLFSILDTLTPLQKKIIIWYGYYHKKKDFNFKLNNIRRSLYQTRNSNDRFVESMNDLINKGIFNLKDNVLSYNHEYLMTMLQESRDLIGISTETKNSKDMALIKKNELAIKKNELAIKDKEELKEFYIMKGKATDNLDKEINHLKEEIKYLQQEINELRLELKHYDKSNVELEQQFNNSDENLPENVTETPQISPQTEESTVDTTEEKEVVKEVYIEYNGQKLNKQQLINLFTHNVDEKNHPVIIGQIDQVIKSYPNHINNLNQVIQLFNQLSLQSEKVEPVTYGEVKKKFKVDNVKFFGNVMSKKEAYDVTDKFLNGNVEVKKAIDMCFYSTNEREYILHQKDLLHLVKSIKEKQQLNQSN